MRRFAIYAIAILFFCSAARAADIAAADTANTGEQPSTVFLFSYFHDNGGPGDGLHLAWSEDGYNWSALNGDKILFKPTISKVFRDPFITVGPDNVFRMLWTTGWNGTSIGYAESKDLLTWTNEKELPVMANEPKSRNCWAPEMFFDLVKGQYMIFWASTIPGRFPNTDSTGDDGYNHRIYYTTTKDFNKFEPAKILYNNGFNVIDATLIVGNNRYVMFVKDETRWPPRKYIEMSITFDLEGPYSKPSKPITASWTEGPSVIRIGGQWFLYYDNYVLNTYGLSITDDLKHWTNVSSQLKMPAGARHGTAFEVPYEVFSKLPK